MACYRELFLLGNNFRDAVAAANVIPKVYCKRLKKRRPYNQSVGQYVTHLSTYGWKELKK